MDDNLERLYREHIELNQRLLNAIEHQTDVLSRCICDAHHQETVDRMAEHNEIKSKLNIGILQMLAIFAGTILDMFLRK